MKTCGKCLANKPMESFYQDRSRPDGRRNSCIECDKAHKRTPEVREQTRRYNHSEKGKAAQARFTASGNRRSGEIAYNAHYRKTEAYKAHSREYHRQYYRTAKAQDTLKRHRFLPEVAVRMRAYKVAWMQSPRGHAKMLANSRQHCRKRQSLKRGLTATFAQRDWRKCLAFFEHCCAYCGRQIRLEQDHFIPISAAGTYTPDNIVPACKLCNVRKRNKLPDEWCSAAVYAHVQAYFRSLIK